MTGSPGGRRPPRAVLHLDMDAFFVNVHLLDHPEHKGRPLAVGGRPNARGVVASASYEARAFGVRSAMPMSRAVRLCPGLVIVSAAWPRIKECSRQVMRMLQELGPIEPMSVDEAYVELTGHPDPARAALELPERVLQQTGLPASIGLATSKLVAKVASDFDKPAGRVIVPPGGEADFLAPLPVRVLWGIGPRTGERLAALGLESCAQLAAADPAQLVAHLGPHAATLPDRARGVDRRPVQSERGPARSISSETTFRTDRVAPDQIRPVIEELAARVASGLQSEDLFARTVGIKCRDADFRTFTRQRTLTQPTEDGLEVKRQALRLWEQHWPPGRPMRLVGVFVSNLVEVRERQLELF